MAGSSFDDDGGGIRPDRPYRVDLSSPEFAPEAGGPGEIGAGGDDDGVDGRRGRIGRVMQRLFRPDQFAKEQMLLDVIEDLPQSRSEHELARQVLDAIDQGLQPEAAHLFVRRAVRFRLLRSTDRPDEGKVLLPTEFRLPAMAAEWHEPRATASLPDVGHDERAWLRSWRVRWAVPVRHPDPAVGLCGLLLLGARPGDGSYSADSFSTVQRDLLQAMAGRLALELNRHFDRRRERLRESRGRGDWLLECPECGRCYGPRDFFCVVDDSTVEPTLLVEREVAGRYRLEQRLGRGGMGRVYRAHDLRDDRPVALKVVTGGDRVALGRFSNEARAGRKIQHPAVVEVVDSGEVGRFGAYLVMEFIDGDTLRDALKKGGSFDPADLAEWLDDVLAGVAAAHDKGIIHRDLKPENIMITRPGGEDGGDSSRRRHAKVLDFGLAKLREETGSGPGTLTGAGMVIGTLAYMSPEQLQADDVDHRTDLYTLGVIAAEALTGELPFQAESLGEMLRMVAGTPFRMDVANAEQASVADILGRALEKSADDRYPDVEGFRRELIPALKKCPPFT